MRSLFAALRSLVLPAGATSGPRIVLNGLAGVIEIYDASGQLYATIAPTTGFTSFDPASTARYIRLTTDPVEGPFIDFGQADGSIDTQGYLQHYVDGAGGTRNLVLEASPGKFTTSDDCRLLLTSESEDGTEASVADLFAGGLRTRPAGVAVANTPRFAVWTTTGTLDAGGSFSVAGTPVTGANVLLMQGRYTDAGGASIEFGGGLVASSTGTVFNFGGAGGANRPYRVVALYTP